MFKHQSSQEPPFPSPSPGAMYSCPHCHALMVGRPSVCPNCNERLLNTSQAGAYVSPPEEFSFGRALAAATLIVITPFALLIGVLCMVPGFDAVSRQSRDMMSLGAALVCFLIATGCVAGVVALFKKRG